MKKPKEEKYEGVLDGFAETGSEGVCWILDTKPDSKKYNQDALIFIKPGDHLKVYDKYDFILFEGEIVPDFKIGWTRYPKNPDPKMGQQLALGFWVHWIQNGWAPDEWAYLFIRHWFKVWGKKPKFRAELIRKPKRTR